jgi:hypothetical protein
MAGLVAACAARGTSRGTRAGAWIVSHRDHGELVLEGPALDVLLEAGATPVRPATWAERLLGDVIRTEGPGGSAESP